MTLKNMTELLQGQFPERPRTYWVFELNKALRRWCQQTGILYAVDTLTRADDYLSDDSTLMTATYQCPADIYELIQVDELTREGYELRDDELIIHTIEPDLLDILTIRYSRIPSVMAADSDSPSIPEYLHDVLVSIVAGGELRKQGDQKGYMMELDIQARFYAMARKYIASVHYRNTGAFVGDDMAQKVTWGAQTLTAGINVVDMTPKSFTSVNSFILMLNGNGVEVSEYDPLDDNAERTVSTFKVYSADANPNFEYFAIGT